VPGSIEVAQRQKGYNRGLFEWIRKAPWGNPVFSGMFISLVGFGFLGGISGVMMGTEQLNIIIHNTVYVPGHFHATVVVGTTLAFMSLTYFLIPVLFRRQMILPGLAKWQPYLFGIGMSLFSLFMMGAGTLGVSRRHWDMAFTGSSMPYEYPGTAYLMMGLMALAGLAAVIGGIIYLLITVGSLLWGKRLDAKDTYGKTITPLRLPPVAAAIEGHGTIGVGGFAAPGVFVFAMVFLVAFVLYYFINWKYLGSVWGLS
jgi:cytochrome c oxidase subunit 1